MGSYSRRLSRTQRRWSTRHQIDMAWLAAPGRPQRDVAIHGDDLCATSVITPCVQSANLRGTHSSARRGFAQKVAVRQIPLLGEGWPRRHPLSKRFLEMEPVSDHPVCGASVASRLLLMPQPPLLT